MEKLFDDSLFIQKERPTKITDQQKEQLYVDLANEVIDNQYSEDDLKTIIGDLKQLSKNDSGFEKAQYLKNYGSGEYNFCGDFIDWLDDMDYNERQILGNNIELWVQAHNPEPKFKKGTKLIVEKRIGIAYAVTDVIYITGLQEKRANYLVDEDPQRQGGIILAYEIIEQHCSAID